MGNLHPWNRDGLTIDFVQHIRVNAGEIWPFLTTADGIATWLKTTTAEIPTKPGKPFRLEWHAAGRTSKEAVSSESGTVYSVVEHRLLALEWTLQWSGIETKLSIVLEPSFAEFGYDRGAGCDLWLVQSGFPLTGVGRQEYDGMFRHWRQAIGLLACNLEGRKPRPTSYAVSGLQFVGGSPADGLLIADVIDGSPADKAGITRGDCILAIDGSPIGRLDDYHDWVVERTPGDTADLTLKDRTVVIRVESIDDARNRLLLKRDDGWSSSDLEHQDASSTNVLTLERR